MPAAIAADPTRDVLWVALQGCVLAKRATGRSFPCLSVDLGDGERPGTAVLRVPSRRTHMVVMPTDNVSGIEAPVLQGPAESPTGARRSRPGATSRTPCRAGCRPGRSASR